VISVRILTALSISSEFFKLILREERVDIVLRNLFQSVRILVCGQKSMEARTLRMTGVWSEA
jgi:hypothetical protein